MRSGQLYQHRCFNASDLSFPDSQIIEANSRAAKPVTHSSSALRRIGAMSTIRVRIDCGMSASQTK